MKPATLEDVFRPLTLARREEISAIINDALQKVHEIQGCSGCAITVTYVDRPTGIAQFIFAGGEPTVKNEPLDYNHAVWADQ